MAAILLSLIIAEKLGLMSRYIGSLVEAVMDGDVCSVHGNLVAVIFLVMMTCLQHH